MKTTPKTFLIRCPDCGANNRVSIDAEGSHRMPVCGRCHKPLPVSAEPVAVTDATFTDLVVRSPLPVLLDMWAPWCGPCRLVAPILDQLAQELAGEMLIAKLNVDENPVTSSRFGVQSIPTLLILKNGLEVDRIVGAQPKAEILRRLEFHK